jgi:hypothetical protein
LQARKSAKVSESRPVFSPINSDTVLETSVTLDAQDVTSPSAGKCLESTTATGIPGRTVGLEVSPLQQLLPGGMRSEIHVYISSLDVPYDSKERFYGHVQKHIQNEVPQFSGLEISYESWRKVFGNKISCCAPRADDAFLGRWIRDRMHPAIADEAQLQMGVDHVCPHTNKYWLVGGKELDN